MGVVLVGIFVISLIISFILGFFGFYTYRKYKMQNKELTWKPYIKTSFYSFVLFIMAALLFFTSISTERAVSENDYFLAAIVALIIGLSPGVSLFMGAFSVKKRGLRK